jgi:hypothetical protein
VSLWPNNTHPVLVTKSCLQRLDWDALPARLPSIALDGDLLCAVALPAVRGAGSADWLELASQAMRPRFAPHSFEVLGLERRFTSGTRLAFGSELQTIAQLRRLQKKYRGIRIEPYFVWAVNHVRRQISKPSHVLVQESDSWTVCTLERSNYVRVVQARNLSSFALSPDDSALKTYRLSVAAKGKAPHLPCEELQLPALHLLVPHV